MPYEITGIGKNGKHMKRTEYTSSNAQIIANVLIKKGAKNVKIKHIKPR